jgi:hypothetical protein
VILSSRQFFDSGYGAFGRIFVAAVVLALILQGGHVCQPVMPNAPGVQAAASAAAPFCTVCAIAQSMLLAAILILLLLIPSRAPSVLLSIQAKTFWHGLRLNARPPPVLA